MPLDAITKHLLADTLGIGMWSRGISPSASVGQACIAMQDAVCSEFRLPSHTCVASTARFEDKDVLVLCPVHNEHGTCIQVGFDLEIKP